MHKYVRYSKHASLFDYLTDFKEVYKCIKIDTKSPKEVIKLCERLKLPKLKLFLIK